MQLTGSIAAEKPFEIGGYIDLETAEVVPTSRGKDADSLGALEFYSMYWEGPRITFHTHPRILLDQIDPRFDGKEFLKFPSYMDFQTSLKLNIKIAEKTPPEKRLPITYEMVLTDTTLCLFKPEEKLVDYLLTIDEEVREDMIDNFIVPNSGSVGREVVEAKMSFDESVDYFQRELASIFRRKHPETGDIIFESGFTVHMFPLSDTRHLYSADFQDRISKSFDTLPER